MTTIKEVLKQYESRNNFEVVIKHTQLESLFKKLLDSDYAFIANLVLNYRNEWLLTPESIQNFLEPLGLGTIEEVDEFLQKHKALNNIFFPKITVNNLSTITISEIQNILKNSWLEFEPHVYYDFGDSNYYLLDKPTLDIILTKCKIDKRPYVKSKFDCEDFARATKAWVTLNIEGNVTFANVVGIFYKGDGLQFAHGFNLVIYTDNGKVQVSLVEPQKDMIISSQEDVPKWFFTANKVKLRFIQF